MTLMQRRRALMAAKKENSPRIPASYQEVEWVGYIGHGNYIITSITCGRLTKVVADIAKTALPGGTNSGSVFPSTFQPGLIAANGKNWGTLENISGSTFTASPSHAKADLFDRTTITSTKGSPESTYYVGIGYNTDKFCPALRFYSFCVLNGTTVLFDGVPCYRKSDSKIGMYDLISNQFVASSGTWTKGADIT